MTEISISKMIAAILMILSSLLSSGISDTADKLDPAATEPWEQRPSTAGKLSVEGTALVGEDGQTVQLRGASTHGLAWFPRFVNAGLFKEMSEDWGANCVRLAMYTAEYGGYCTGGDKEALRKLVLDGVKYAKDSDMYVIVDWHILSDGDPNTYKSEAKSFFDTVTRELKDYDNVLYEICNEPNGGTTWAQIKEYAKEVIPVIRQNAPDAVILVGTPNWSQRVDEAARDPITDYDNLMYTLHFYSGTHKGELRSTLQSAHDAGLPVFVSEYGITDASGNGALNTEEADRWMELLDQYSISSMMWSLSNKDESSAIISSATDKASGFTEDDLTGSGKYLLGLLSGEAAGTGSGGAQTGPGGGTQGGQNTLGTTTQEGVLEGENLKWKLDAVNAWTSGGKSCIQYTLTVTNTGSAPASTWRVTFDLGGDFTLTSSWNAAFSKSGTTLTVTPMDYNSAIPAGGSVGDIGFIVER